MKLNTLFVAAICAGTLFNSCVNKTATENQLKYTHTSLADNDAFSGFQVIGENALSGAKYAEWAEKSGDAKAQEVAAKVKGYYTQLIPALDTLATSLQVDFPIKGIPTGHDEAEGSETTTDSTAHVAHNHFDYVAHAQHEVATVKERLERLTRNTNKDVQTFAKQQVELISELYTQIGGKVEAHAHH